ncbi:hypothetical protein GGX14DRAFT_570674 [Mycena pura]|uniref:Uncharacterized protein n=1 Tax=Mycena pura TaxID=153505 RepID=A0AAD6UJS9_9AGAR|nr:hypothetical protein GGX14DRAFT_580958 [Mycena pura]KAJ7202567.1 hypothetical protein GGX14DRAFT_570674 [Mycena pura]
MQKDLVSVNRLGTGIAIAPFAREITMRDYHQDAQNSHNFNLEAKSSKHEHQVTVAIVFVILAVIDIIPTLFTEKGSVGVKDVISERHTCSSFLICAPLLLHSTPTEMLHCSQYQPLVAGLNAGAPLVQAVEGQNFKLAKRLSESPWPATTASLATKN